MELKLKLIHNNITLSFDCVKNKKYIYIYIFVCVCVCVVFSHKLLLGTEFVVLFHNTPSIWWC